MKTIALAIAAMLLSSCGVMMVPLPRVHQHVELPVARPITKPQGSVRIVPSHGSEGTSSMVVIMRAEAVDMEPPLRFHWHLGNGREWNGPEPPPQTYIVGRYDVILTVTDAVGRVRKASMNVDAQSHGCTF